MTHSRGLVLIVMGVSGCGKSAVATQLASKLGAVFKDADELHPAENITRMSAGIALTDEDREPWLESVAAYAREQSLENKICVIACSALKRQYRNLLNGAGEVLYIYLQGSPELIRERLNKRAGHFMPEDLLDSQFATLEEPDAASETVVSIDIKGAIGDVVDVADWQVRRHPLFSVLQ